MVYWEPRIEKNEVDYMENSRPHKLLFSRDQIVTATQASKNFGEVRERALGEPIFVSGRNGIDTVIIDYQTFEDMSIELANLREQHFYSVAAQRVLEGDATPDRERIALKDAMGVESFGEFQTINPEAISDEDLFE